jgi:hypothetical protein
VEHLWNFIKLQETVNSIKEYGEWCSAISFNVADVDGIIARQIAALRFKRGTSKGSG